MHVSGQAIVHKFDIETRPSDSTLVDHVWRAQADGPGSFISVASVHCQIVVTRHHGRTFLTVRGPETRPTVMHFPAGAAWFGIDLRLGAFLPEFPPRSLLDQHDATLPAATSQSFWLHGSAWPLPTFDTAEVFVRRLERERLLVLDPLVEAVRAGQAPELSVRSVQYRFLRATGLSHSLVRQIERARAAAELLRRGMPVLDVVDLAGYFDQPHLTRSLTRFVGQTPAQIALGD
jgi:Helix-turn-helix domain